MAIHPYARFFVLPSAPTVDEDETEGYEVGDVVFYGGSFYDCSDTTAGAAVWTERGSGSVAWGAITGTLADQADLQNALDNHDHTDHVHKVLASVDPTVNDDTTMGYEPPTIWINTVTNVPWILADSADGAAVWLSMNTYTQDEVDGMFDALNVVYASISHNHDASYTPLSGWLSVSQTWTFVSADDPVYQIYVSGDVTANAYYKVGNKVKCTNNATTFYGIIHKVGVYDSGNNRTPVDIFGGTDYDLANLTITAPYISKVKSPDGFPMQEEKWSHEVVATNSPAKSGPVANNWYGGALLSPTGPSLDIPIGNWRLSYLAVAEFSSNLAAAANIGLRVTLSTANNSESHPEHTTGFTVTLPVSATAIQRATYQISDRVLNVVSKTTFYLNMFTGNAAGTGPVMTLNPGGVFRIVIRVVDAYL